MTSIAAPPAPSLPTAPGRTVFPDVLRAELLKLRTVRSTYAAVLTGVLSNLGLALLAATVIAPRLGADERAHVDVVQLALAGLHLSQIAFGVLGALIITSEYGSGMVRTTLAAVPRRRTLLAAKALVLTGVTLTCAILSMIVAYLMFRATLPAGILTGTAWSAPGVARAVIGGGLYLTALALLGFGLGALLRSSAAAIATLFGLLFVPPLLLDLLPDSWRTTVGPYIPMQAGDQIYIAVRHEATALAPWSGFAVFCLYAAVTVLAATVLMTRRDA